MVVMLTPKKETPNSPHFSLEECLTQIFGTSFLSDEDEAAYINYHEDGYYDSSIQHYLPIIAYGLSKLYDNISRAPLCDESALKFVSQVGTETNDDTKSILNDIRKKLKIVANHTKPHSRKSPQDFIIFYTNIYNLGRTKMLRNAENRGFSRRVGEILADDPEVG